LPEKAKLKGTSYHIIVTIWLTIKNHKTYLRGKVTKHLVSSTKKSGEQLSEEKWFAQVKNPNTGEFFQLEDLRAVGAVPADFRTDEKPKRYPLKKIDEIYRIKKVDGTEWLKSRQTWIGLDRFGNDITKCFVILNYMINLCLTINLNQ
jgi:hypothetical protein